MCIYNSPHFSLNNQKPRINVNFNHCITIISCKQFDLYEFFQRWFANSLSQLVSAYILNSETRFNTLYPQMIEHE
ncbi:hypothetical protein DLR65_05215 [Vibrio tarriae]|nr:hypothetical protein DLR59_01520 [Vibrio tarriae]RBM32472.1 hypothetical protein DLR58_14585 [Vibrio tarriae]RBM39744.1 hypothetical protein DLR63_07665 [Vibrio tarriae]RBM51077.1 hypothetical protein DLR65_05215 [Vibrio tarriae]